MKAATLRQINQHQFLRACDDLQTAYSGLGIVRASLRVSMLKGHVPRYLHRYIPQGRLVEPCLPR